MGILSKLLGGGIAEPVTAIGNVAEKIFGNKKDKLSFAEFKLRLEASPMTAHQELQKLDAQSRRGFQANWRPFIGWVCGVGIAIQYVVSPVLSWATGKAGPEVDLATLLPLLMALLGLAGYRTIEKFGNKTK